MPMSDPNNSQPGNEPLSPLASLLVEAVQGQVREQEAAMRKLQRALNTLQPSRDAAGDHSDIVE